MKNQTKNKRSDVAKISFVENASHSKCSKKFLAKQLDSSMTLSFFAKTKEMGEVDRLVYHDLYREKWASSERSTY